MADWILIACLIKLRAEFDAAFPKRKKASDGSIGNDAHSREVSDHNPDETGSVPIHDADHINEVHAIDVDNQLDGTLRIDQPNDPMERVVQFLLGRCRSGAEKRLRYIIYNRRIWEKSNGWRQRTYAGTSPHREHAHFSAEYDTTLEASTASWGMATALNSLEDSMALDTNDKNWFGAALGSKFQAMMDELAAVRAALPQEVWDKPRIKNAYSGAEMSPGTALSYAPSRTPTLEVGAKVDALTAAFTSFVAADTADDAAKGQALTALRDSLTALGPQLVAGVVAGVQAELEQHEGVQLTQEMANTAFETALRNVFAVA